MATTGKKQNEQASFQSLEESLTILEINSIKR